MFSITVILSDYTVIVISSEDELEDLIDDCSGENEPDDDIECADIQYPVTASIFNSNNEVLDVITFTNDRDRTGLSMTWKMTTSEIWISHYRCGVRRVGGRVRDLHNPEDILDDASDDRDEDDDDDYNDDDCDSRTTKGCLKCSPNARMEGSMFRSGTTRISMSNTKVTSSILPKMVRWRYLQERTPMTGPGRLKGQQITSL